MRDDANQKWTTHDGKPYLIKSPTDEQLLEPHPAGLYWLVHYQGNVYRWSGEPKIEGLTILARPPLHPRHWSLERLHIHIARMEEQHERVVPLNPSHPRGAVLDRRFPGGEPPEDPAA